MNKINAKDVLDMIVDLLNKKDALNYDKIKTVINNTLDTLEEKGYNINRNYSQADFIKVVSNILSRKPEEFEPTKIVEDDVNEYIQEVDPVNFTPREFNEGLPKTGDEQYLGGSLNLVESKKREKLKSLIKEYIYNVNLESSFNKYVNELQEAFKSFGTHVSVIYRQEDGSPNKLSHIFVDDGEGGFCFAMTIYPESRNKFSVNYTIGGTTNDQSIDKSKGSIDVNKGPLTMEELKKWIKVDFKKMIKSLDKESPKEEIDDKSMEIKDKEIKKQIDVDNVKAELKNEKQVSQQEGGNNVGKFDRQEDAKMITKHIAHDEKELKIKSKKDGMEKTKIKRQDSIKTKMPEKPAKTKDIKKSHLAESIDEVVSKNPFKVGDEVKLRTDVLQRHDKSVPAHMGYTTHQFKWRDTLRSLDGKVGKIKLLFPNSKHVNVDFDGQVIGLDYTELEPVSNNSQDTNIDPKREALKEFIKSILKDTL